MLYKEWVSARPRMLTWLMVYGMLALALVISRQTLIETGVPGREYTYNINPIYRTWLTISLLLTLVAALFGGAENISDEVDRGTLSFLLTRPVSRKQIYTTKILMNIAGLVATFIPCSLIVFVVDRFQPFPIPLWEGLGFTLLWLASGITLICLGGLVSIFTHNALQTVAFTIAIPVIAATVITFGLYYLNIVGIYLQLSPEWITGLSLAGMTGLSAGLFWAGLKAFSRKQF